MTAFLNIEAARLEEVVDGFMASQGLLIPLTDSFVGVLTVLYQEALRALLTAAGHYFTFVIYSTR